MQEEKSKNEINEDLQIDESSKNKKIKKESIKKEPELISITWNICNRIANRLIYIDEDNKSFICIEETKGYNSKTISYPYGKNKKETLKTIIEHGEFYCFKQHKIYPKTGEFADLYK